jgi:hypothetical protein
MEAIRTSADCEYLSVYFKDNINTRNTLHFTGVIGVSVGLTDGNVDDEHDPCIWWIVLGIPRSLCLAFLRGGGRSHATFDLTCLVLQLHTIIIQRDIFWRPALVSPGSSLHLHGSFEISLVISLLQASDRFISAVMVWMVTPTRLSLSQDESGLSFSSF